MAHDQLTGLLALKVVAETRNFTAAAKATGLSPSAVSQTIRRLEGRWGVVPLFRTTRSMSLTEAGDQTTGSQRNLHPQSNRDMHGRNALCPEAAFRDRPIGC
jgi:DNA-binding transcriptional LysR family regulator